MKLAESELGKVPAPGRRPESDTLEMQGHPKGKGHPKGQPANENQLLSSQLNAPASTTTTSAPMDSNNQQQPAAQGSSSAPQIRSRITVVCAECKRLKLKCDRRTPCGSCTKRDTVARCIYSPAAAEKVDLHSLNNRLIQTETCLTMLTQGKTPPPFQSSYPLSQPSVPSSHLASHSNARHPKMTVTPTSSISIPIHDLMTIWLVHCQLDLKYSAETRTFQKLDDQDGNSCIKLEPSPVDMLHLSAPYPEEPIVIDDNFQMHNTSTFPLFDLPPLSIYYSPPHTSSNQATAYTYPTTNHYPTQDTYMANSYSYPTSFSQTPQQTEYEFPPSTHTPHTPSSPTTSSSNGTSSTSHNAPSITPALFTRLPSPSIRAQLIQRARATHPQLALWVPWDRIMELADLGSKEKEKEKAEKTEKKKLAVAIFFPNSAEPVPTPTSSGSQSSVPTTSLPLFVCLCYILALGALEKGVESSEEYDASAGSGFLYALAGQAMGVWEGHQYRASNSENDEDVGATNKMKTKDVIDLFMGYLLQVAFLFREGAGKGKQGLQAAFPLIGKLVNTARSLGLSRDPDEDLVKGTKRGSKSEKEVKRMLWWEAMFYDTFISDALKQPALTSLSSYSTRMPACAASPTPIVPSSSSSRKFQTDDLGDAEGDDDYDDADADEEYSDEEQWNSDLKRRGKSSGKHGGNVNPAAGKAKAKDRTETHVEGSRDEVFFGVRCRLTQLAQSIKRQFANPGCECCGNGYTLDHAFKLEGDVRTWISDLPQSLKLDASPPSGANAKCNAIIAAELAIMANRLIIAAYVPFLKPSSNSSSSSYASRSWSPASRSTVDAAQGVVSAARVLHMLTRGCGAENGMMMKEFYPLDKAVLDAIVICAHAGLSGGGKVHKEKDAIEDMAMGLNVLGTMGGGGRGDMGRIIGALRRKLDGLSGGDVGDSGRAEENLLKRKYDQVEASFEGESHGLGEREGDGLDEMLLDFETPYARNADGMSEAVIPDPPAAPQSPAPQRTLPQQLLQRPQSRHSSPQRKDSLSSRTKNDKEKDKKHAKKGHNGYPSFGIRVRKELPPFAKRTEPTSTTRTSSPGEPPRVALQAAPSSVPPQPHPQNLMPSVSQDQAYRSRSSSITQTQDPRVRDPTQPQPMNFSLPFAGSAQGQIDLHVMPRSSFGLHEQQQPSQNQPFGSSPTTLYNPSQHPSRSGSFDHHRGTDQPQNSFDNTDTYVNESSPYPNSSAPLSAASSPYASTGGPPPTPTFGSGPPSTSHHPSPPTFGQPPSTSPQTFYRIPGGYDSAFDRHSMHQQQPMIHGIPMDTSMGDQGTGSSGIHGSSDPNPLYEKSTSHTMMYDGKQRGLDLISPMQYQALSNQNQSHQHPLVNPSMSHTWNPMHSAPPPQTLGDQNVPQFWSGAMYYN